MIMRNYHGAVYLSAGLCLAACGGGGSSNDGSSALTRDVNLPFVSVTICVPGNGTPPAPNNVLPVTVDAGPTGNSNVPQAQQSTSCQTVDHILVDTASSGLRIMSSVLSAPLSNLPRQTVNGNDLAECTVFADGFSWGSVRLADVYLAGETASSIPIQIIGDPAFPSIPSSCSSLGVEEDTVASFGSNGILGVSTFAEDCGPTCAQGAIPGNYYTCPSGCQPVLVSAAQQLPNPVTKFALDKSGVVLQLPMVPSSGAATVTGTLTFGIGTQTNNALGAATIYNLDTVFGNFTTTYNGQFFSDSAFLDSGSNALYFPDATIPVCGTMTLAPGFYCPSTTLALTATHQGYSNLHTNNFGFFVANADSLLSMAPNFSAFNNIAGQAIHVAVFDWGLPFFYGRRIFFAIEPPSGAGPYVAY